MQSYKEQYSFEQRKAEADRILTKYPDRIPIIVERSRRSNIQEIDKNKYLVPSELTLGQFKHVLSKRIKLTSDQAIFIFVNNTTPSISTLISDLYDRHKDECGFLFLYYSGEATFGMNNL